MASVLKDDFPTRICLSIAFQIALLNIFYEYVIEPSTDDAFQELLSSHLWSPILSSLSSVLRPLGLHDALRSTMSHTANALPLRSSDTTLLMSYRAVSRTARWLLCAVAATTTLVVGLYRGLTVASFAAMASLIGIAFIVIGCLQYIVLTAVVMRFTPICASEAVGVAKRTMLQSCLDAEVC